jgi:hypothetical protein
MARLPKGHPLTGITGKIDNTIVFKNYSYGTVVSSYPDMSRIKVSIRQKRERSKFADAVSYAQKINRNPELKKKFPMKQGEHVSVYHAALSSYLRGEIWEEANPQ